MFFQQKSVIQVKIILLPIDKMTEEETKHAIEKPDIHEKFQSFHLNAPPKLGLGKKGKHEHLPSKINETISEKEYSENDQTKDNQNIDMQPEDMQMFGTEDHRQKSASSKITENGKSKGNVRFCSL